MAARRKVTISAPRYVVPALITKIVALDPSLGSSGLAVLDRDIFGDDDGNPVVGSWRVTDVVTLKPPAGMAGLERLRWIEAKWVREWGFDNSAHEIGLIIEGASYGSGNSPGFHERAGLWWRLADRADRDGVPLAIMAPTGRAKYATGKGTAGKGAVLAETAVRYRSVMPTELNLTDDNQADALVMAAALADLTGNPLVKLPAAHREALGQIHTL